MLRGVGFGIVLLVVFVACSSGSSVAAPCNVLYDCPAGQTCWALDGKNWSCMASGSGALGSTCESVTNTDASCGDGLACLAMGNPQAGTCVAWCDSEHPCPSTSPCTAVSTAMGATLHFCQ